MIANHNTAETSHKIAEGVRYAHRVDKFRHEMRVNTRFEITETGTGGADDVTKRYKVKGKTANICICERICPMGSYTETFVWSDLLNKISQKDQMLVSEKK